MILTCPACDASFRVEEAALGPQGRRVRCSACGQEWHARPGQATLVKAIRGRRRRRSRPALLPQAQEDGVTVESRQKQSPEKVGEDLGAPPALQLTALREEMIGKDLRRAGKRRTRRPGRWLLILLMLTAMLALALVWAERDAILAAFPPSAAVYRLLGAEPEASLAGLSLQDVTLLRRRINGQSRLIVEGWIKNGSRQDLPVPVLQARLLDAAGTPLQRWSFKPAAGLIAAGGRQAFTTETADLREALTIDIDFMRSGES